MAQLEAAAAYISVATNRYPYAAAVRDSLVACASSTYIALWNSQDINEGGVHETLPGHQAIVTCVRFICDNVLLSADEQGVIRLWRRDTDKWKVAVSHSAHTKAVSALAVYGDLVVTGASDSLIKVWKLTTDSGADSISEVQSIDMKSRFPLSIDIARLPRSESLILAVGGTDRSIQIWTRSDRDFVHSASLSGHEDWVKSLAFRETISDDKLLVLASGSQDSTIRLWNIEQYERQTPNFPTDDSTNPLSDGLLDEFEASLGDLADAEEGGRQISLKRHVLTVRHSGKSQQQFTVTFDALLIGHEAGVTSLAWRPSSAPYAEHTLLSTSTDSSLILWSPSTILSASQDASATLWINRHRFGDVGGQRLGGFIFGFWSQGGREAFACSWSGGWRRWRCITGPSGETTDRLEQWQEVGAITGHTGPIKGLAWSPEGEYLISTGLDQTTRIHGEIRARGDIETRVWHEISRPQVHGYDMLDAAFITPLKFVSIADEKVARVFEAPREFVETAKNLETADFTTDSSERPRAATVPPLGLSNKAVSDSSSASAFDVERTTRRPFEGELAAFTLWPETEKIFGHGYESITLALSSARHLVATACKATTAEHAVVRVYETEKWQLVGTPLPGHTLTVTSIAFSPDDKYILSVSRDRSWRLFESKGDNGEYIPVAADKSHARIIWDCSWAHEGDLFATASRDKTVKLWHTRNVRGSEKWVAETTIKLPEAATAVSFAPADETERRTLAIGLESGEIALYSSELSAPAEWHEVLFIPSQTAHVGHIHRLTWRPGQSGSRRQIASCSEDGTLKVLNVHVKR